MDSRLSLADLCTLHLGRLNFRWHNDGKSNTFSFIPKEGRIHLLDMNDGASNLINLEIVVDHDLKLNPHGLGFGRNIFVQ